MKKWFVLLLCCIVLCLSACASEQVFEETVATTLSAATGFAFPEETQVCGVDIGGKSPEAAANAVSEKASNYSLNLTVNETSVSVSGEEMSFFFDLDAFGTFCEAAKAGNTAQPENLISYDASSVRAILSAALESKPVDAQIVFSEEEDTFICLPSVDGVDVDLDAVMAEVDQAVMNLSGNVSIAAEQTVLPAAVATDDSRIAAALAAANGYLKASPKYVYVLDRGETAVETLAEQSIASFVRIGADFTVSVDEAAVKTYADQMADQYSSQARTGDFVTTSGATVPLTVEYDGRSVDAAALAADISLCLTEGTRGTREVPYSMQADVAELPFGGNYIEIDLTAQKLWVYQNGEIVVESPLVSGCVADGRFTPNGVYEVYEKDRDCWLTGPTWNDFVEYWLAFYQGFGIHDASWRSEFGGDIYLYEGSHGCPNLPPELADDVYYSAPLGTKVILYGGATQADPLTQEITGKTVYDLKMGAEPFKLDVNLKYPGAELRYRTSNPQVATVAEDGTVTVTGPGSAVITVVASGFTFHSGANMPVRINVTP